MKLRKNVLCDVDHTLANSFWRDSMIGVASWDEYHAASENDAPLRDIIIMICTLQEAGYRIIGITARPGKWRQLTMNWMVRNGVCMDELLMRPDDNYWPAPKIKLTLALERFPNIADEVAFVMDDREDVAEAFKALGVTVLQVHGRQK